MKKILLTIILVVLAFQLYSCNQAINEQNQDSVTTTSLQTESSVDSTGTEAIIDTPNSENIVGIELVDYPAPYAVSEYSALTEDQKIAYDALSMAIADILRNGPVVNKEYALSKRIKWYDFQTAKNLFNANFYVTDDINILLLDKDSLGTQTNVDIVYLYGYEPKQIEKYYTTYLTVNTSAEQILSSLKHDGTDYGKAYSIAKWLVDNVDYAYDHDERQSEDFSSAYSAIVNKYTICDGYARAFDFLCKKAGLETIYVTSNSKRVDSAGHAWNMIRINDEWYHVDVTWMYDTGDFYKYFMMTDELCSFLGHEEWEYYRVQETNEIINPVADSYKLYKYAYDSSVNMIEHFENNIEIDTNVTYFAVLPAEKIDTVMDYKGVELTSKINEKKYHINITEIGQTYYSVNFLEKLYNYDSTNVDDETTNGITVNKGMRKILYHFDSVIYNFDFFTEKNVNPICLSIDIAEYMVGSVDIENCKTYMRYDKENVMYIRGFEFQYLYGVSSNFVMDESIHEKTNYAGTWNSLAEFDVSTGVTSLGYNFILYENKNDIDYFAYAYIRISDEYIVCLNYWDWNNNYELLMRSIDSIHLNIS